MKKYKIKELITIISLLLIVLIAAGQSTNELTNLKVHVATGHSEKIEAIAYSPDGKYIATGNRSEIIIWDANTGRELKNIPSAASALTFTPDGNYIIRGYSTLSMLDIRTGIMEREFEGDTDFLESIVISPDGKYILTTDSYFPTAKLWDIANGSLIRTFEGHKKNYSWAVNDANFSPDGKYIVTAGDDGTVKLWDTQTGNNYKTFTPKTYYNTVHSAFFLNNGKYILSTSDGGKNILWDINSGKKIDFFESGYIDSQKDVAYSSDGKYFAATDYEDVKVWNINSTKPIIIKNLMDFIYSIEYSPDGKKIVVAGMDKINDNHYFNYAILVDIGTGKVIREFKGFKHKIKSVAFSPKGDLLVTIGEKRNMDYWDLLSGKKKKSIYEIGWAIKSIHFSPNGKTFITSGKNTKLWSIDSGETIKIFDPSEFYSENIGGFTKDGEYIALAFPGGTNIYETSTGKIMKSLDIHLRIHNTRYKPNDNYIMSKTNNYGPKVVDLLGREFGKEYKSFKKNRGIETKCKAYSPDGKYVVFGNSDAQIFNVETGEEIESVSLHRSGTVGYNSVSCLSFNPNSKSFVAGSFNGVVALIEVKTGNIIKTFETHTDGITTVSFSPNGKYIASGSSDGTTKIWGVNSGKKEIISLISLGNKGWAAVTPNGYFDYSQGMEEYIYFVDGLDSYDLEKFRDEFYRPRLLAEVMSDARNEVFEIIAHKTQQNESLKSISEFFGIDADTIIKENTDVFALNSISTINIDENMPKGVELKFKAVINSATLNLANNNLTNSSDKVENNYNNDEIKGCHSGDCIGGYGSFIQDSDGSVYVGNFKNGLYHGKGIMFYNNGKVKKEGKWKKGLFSKEKDIQFSFPSNIDKWGCISGDCSNGKGEYLYKDLVCKYTGNFTNEAMMGVGTYFLKHSKYIGNWEVNEKTKLLDEKQITGNGKYYYNNELSYDGSIIKGNNHGYGTQYLPNGVYIGEFKSGFRSGYGTYKWKSGDTYVGNWKNSKRFGYGTLKYNNDKVYVGNWNNGTQEGQGKYGNYDGEWSNGEITGTGVFSLSNWNVYDGHLINGKFNGQGTMKWEDGTKYTGQWVNDEMTGQGTFYNKDGNSFKGIWSNGEGIDIEVYQQGQYVGKRINGTFYATNELYNGKPLTVEQKQQRAKVEREKMANRSKQKTGIQALLANPLEAFVTTAIVLQAAVPILVAGASEIMPDYSSSGSGSYGGDYSSDYSNNYDEPITPDVSSYEQSSNKTSGNASSGDIQIIESGSYRLGSTLYPQYKINCPRGYSSLIYYNENKKCWMKTSSTSCDYGVDKGKEGLQKAAKILCENND